MTRRTLFRRRLNPATFALAMVVMSAVGSPGLDAQGVSATAAPDARRSNQPEPGWTTEWRQERGDGQRRGFARWPTEALSEPEVLWQLPLGTMWETSPVVASDGTIYLVRGTRPDHTDPEDALFAINPDGTVRWQRNLQAELPLIVNTYCRPPIPENAPWGHLLRATPAIRSDGNLVVLREVLVPQCEGGEITRWVDLGVVFLLDPTGAVVGGPHLIGPLLSAPVLDSDDTAFVVMRVGDGLGVFERFDAGSFDHREISWWRPDAPDLLPDIGGALWDVAEAWTDFLCGNSVLRNVAACFDHSGVDGGSPNDPTRPQSSSLLPSAALSPQCADLVVTGPATVRGWPGAGALWWQDLWARTSPAIGSGGRAYFLTWDDGDWLEARDQDGERAWRLALSHPVVVPPAVGRVPGGDTESGVECERREAPGPGVRIREHRADDQIYVSDVDGFLNAVDGHGRLRWRRPFGNGVSSAPVVIELQNGDEQIIVANDNTLWSFSRDGVPSWFVRLDSPARGSPAVANGRIFVTTETSLYAIGPPRPRDVVVVTQPEKPREDDRLVPPTATPTSTPGPRSTATPTPETRTIVDPARLTPDLSIERVSVRPSGAAATRDCDPGSNVITAVIKNGGSAPSGTFTVRLRVDGREPGDNRRTIGELAAAEETIALFPSVPLSQGTRIVEVSVDPDNRVAERDETNNLTTLQLVCQHELN